LCCGYGLVKIHNFLLDPDPELWLGIRIWALKNRVTSTIKLVPGTSGFFWDMRTVSVIGITFIKAIRHRCNCHQFYHGNNHYDNQDRPGRYRRHRHLSHLGHHGHHGHNIHHGYNCHHVRYRYSQCIKVRQRHLFRRRSFRQRRRSAIAIQVSDLILGYNSHKTQFLESKKTVEGSPLIS
jgi:hypothetical protein